jgi:hypothetical protein
VQIFNSVVRHFRFGIIDETSTGSNLLIEDTVASDYITTGIVVDPAGSAKTTLKASMPAHAQLRVFVSGGGLDTNPCTVTQPCRTFQHAHNIAAANGEIDVLDPAGYGPLAPRGSASRRTALEGSLKPLPPVTPSLSNVTTGDPVTLNGLLIDGGGTGDVGIYIA